MVSICTLERSGIRILGNEEEAGTFLRNPEKASLLAATAGVTLARGQSCMPMLPLYRLIMAWTVLSAIEGGAEVVCGALLGMSIEPDRHGGRLDRAT